MHRNPDDGHGKNRRAHTRQVCRHSCACNNHFKALLLRSLCIFKKYIRLSVCRNDCHFIRNTEFLKHLRCFCHNGHIGIRSHYNTNLGHIYILSFFKKYNNLWFNLCYCTIYCVYRQHKPCNFFVTFWKYFSDFRLFFRQFDRTVISWFKFVNISLSYLSTHSTIKTLHSLICAAA